MAGQDKIETGPDVKRSDEFNDVDNELLHDDTGAQYLINDSFLKEQMERRTNSPDKEMDLQLARELLNSNLRQLTARQKDVLYYTMQNLTQYQIARKLHISTSAVQKHLGYARKKLARLITGTKEILKEGLNNDY